MRLIMENWKRYLEEEEMKEVAQGMGPGGLSELGDITFNIDDDGFYYNIYIISGGEEIGDFQLERAGPDGIYMTHAYTDDSEKGKIGPFVYDMLIELGTLLGGRVASSLHPSGLTDKGKGKSGTTAIDVWKYYYQNRHDLDKKPIEQKPRKFQWGAKYVYPPWAQGKHAWKSGLPEEIELRSLAINHSYTKPPVFLKQLKAAGKLSGPPEIMKLIQGNKQ